MDEKLTKRLWNDVFGDVEWATNCFGTWMYRDAWSNEEVLMIRPGKTKELDYSWNMDHIRPKSNFSDESQAGFMNNFEPMQRRNNL